MNGNDDFIGRLEEYLDDFDGATPLPDHIRDTVHAELPGIRQVRPDAGPRRLLTMLSNTSSRARWGLAAAAIVVAVVVGGAFITNRNQQGVVAAPATPTPTATPSPTPSTTTASSMVNMAQLVKCDKGPGTDCMRPGRYTLGSADWPAAVTFDVPEGWWNYRPGSDFDGLLVDVGNDAPDGSGWGILFMTVGDVSKDPCNPDAAIFAPADVDTPDELAAAMATWPGFETTTPAPITIDDADGVLVDLTSTLSAADCPGGVIWKTAKRDPVDIYPTGGETGNEHPSRFRIVAVRDRLLVVRTTDFPVASPFELSQGVAPDPTRHAGDQVEMQAIVDSIQLDAPQP